VRPQPSSDANVPAQPRGSSAEVLLIFLRLGCLSFGGPIAHLGYFQKEFVERRRWCSASTLAELIALAQSLPGPASSQVGFALGILRSGWPGGLAAWLGFTLPSALLMLAFAYGTRFLSAGFGPGLLHGLQLAAVAVVAQAVFSMQRSLAPDGQRIVLAIAAAGIALFAPGHFATLLAVGVGAVAGLLIFRSRGSEPAESAAVEHTTLRLSRSTGVAAAVLFLAILLLSPLLVRLAPVQGIAIFSTFYRSGALVFGGGHVVLPLLENAVVAPGLVSQQSFLAGYGAAQAMPGPLFTFAAYLGASVRPALHPVVNGLLALVGVFLPGLLAMAAVLPFWSGLKQNADFRAALKGINASVVGVLCAALIHPLWTSTVHTWKDFSIALLAFALLTYRRVQPWIVVAGTALTCILLKFV